MEEDIEPPVENKAIHEVRITDHTKIKQYVTFCLNYLKENPGATLVLHTLPHGSQPREEDAGEEPPATKKRKLAAPIDNIPRLISVAEIIKREFARAVASKEAGDGNPHGTLLHQYNVVDCLPQPEENRDEILDALQGKNYPKRNAIPYMKIYLTTQEQKELEDAGATHQEPLSPPQKTKSAKARERKKQGKIENSNIPIEAPFVA